MEAFFCFLVVLGLSFMGGCEVGSKMGRDVGRDRFIEKHSKEQYCAESTAKVLDKSVTLKRCWIVKELEPK